MKPLGLSVKRFLDAAKASEDNILFYNVFTFIESWLATQKPGSTVAAEEGCAPHVQYFQQVFGGAAPSPALAPVPIDAEPPTETLSAPPADTEAQGQGLTTPESTLS